MKQLQFKILAEDIRKDNYTKSQECPITTALHRAGYAHLTDGGHIYGFDNLTDSVCIVIDENADYHALLVKLARMINWVQMDKDGALKGYWGLIGVPEEMLTPIEPADFEVTINYE